MKEFLVVACPLVPSFCVALPESKCLRKCARSVSWTQHVVIFYLIIYPNFNFNVMSRRRNSNHFHTLLLVENNNKTVWKSVFSLFKVIKQSHHHHHKCCAYVRRDICIIPIQMRNNKKYWARVKKKWTITRIFCNFLFFLLLDMSFVFLCNSNNHVECQWTYISETLA